jgi:hypothetical protein
MHSILGIAVSDAQLQRWSFFLAPSYQPFFLTPEQAQVFGLTLNMPDFSPEERDTYQLWNVGPEQAALLSEAEFLTLDPAQRTELLTIQQEHGRGAVEQAETWRDLLPEVAEQAGGELFIWWPSLLSERELDIFARLLPRDRSPSLHAEVPEAVWAAAGPLLPRARELAGSFAPGSGPNCFGTVMAAAGMPDAENIWTQRGPFEHWLSQATRPTQEPAPGTLLIWRGEGGQVEHAAAVLSSEFVLHKPSQGWDSPRQVIRHSEVLRSWGAASEMRTLAP